MSEPLGNFQVAPTVLLNGLSVPALAWSVDVNSYSLSSSIDVTIPRKPPPGFGPYPDFGAAMQTTRPYPIEIRCAYSIDGRGPSLVLESGYVDERTTDYLSSTPTIAFVGRGTASIFQDVQISKPITRNQAGSSVVEHFFAQRGIPLALSASSPSPQFAGKTAGDPVYAITMRDRTQWDEMQAIALADGFRLSVHAGRGTYGPPDGDPVLRYTAGGGDGLIGLTVRHSPRRSHNIKVAVRSYLPGKKSSVYAVYGSANAASGETFVIPTVSGLTRAQARARAQAIWYDIARKEFLVTARIFPDEAFMRTVSQVGANFSIALGGDIAPSEKLTYAVRQVQFAFDPSSQSAPLVATVLMGNVSPLQNGGFLSS